MQDSTDKINTNTDIDFVSLGGKHVVNSKGGDF